MGDAEKNLPAQNQPFSTPQGDRNDSAFRMPLVMGAAVVVFIVAAVFFFGRKGPVPNVNKTDPYAAKLNISDLHMSTAENFAGSSVTYIEGKITNTGDKKVTGARAELVFKNSLGQTAQQEFLPVMVVLPNIPYVDYGSMDHAALAPGQTRDCRLTLEHVTADWDRQLPQVRVVTVNY